jgi:hypothetical protein
MCMCLCVHVSMCSSRVVEPSGFRVLGFVGALGVFFQYTKPSLSRLTTRQQAQTPISNKKKTPTSDNVGKLEAPLPPKPACNCMCPLEQRASGPSKPEWTPEVVDGRVASKLPKKKTTTPHSDTKTAPVLTTIDDDVTLRRCAPRRPECARRPPPWHRFPGA